MPDFTKQFEKLIDELVRETQTEKRFENEKQRIFRGPKDLSYDKQLSYLDELINLRRQSKYQKLELLLRYPPFHDSHLKFIDQFHEKNQKTEKPFEKSVFIMTKFPERDASGQPKSTSDQELQAVIKAVQAAVTANGFFPRLANDREFHQMLWENVELYLLGCSRGIALLESKYKPELNPNVAMEWGWMRGMGKEVLMLVEDSFAYLRADWGGLLEHRFPWSSPDAATNGHVSGWLKGSAQTATPSP